MARVIKKYENRRLYDTETSSYINLEGVAQLVRDGEEVQVIDRATEEDITRHVLTQIIVEESKAGGQGPSVDFLRDFVRAGSGQRDFLEWYLGTASEVWEKIREGWKAGPQAAAASQQELWMRMLDPLGAARGFMKATRAARRPAPPKPSEAEPMTPEEQVNDAALELAELRRRLEEIEDRLREG